MITSQNFYNLFEIKDEEIVKSIVWDIGPDIGFSILKKYPDKKLFKPVKNNSGEDDSLMLIKVFIMREVVKEGKVLVGLTISNVSQYKIENENIWFEHQYEWGNHLCPTKESMEISKKSIEPINLEETNSYYLDIENKQFFDIKKPNQPIKGSTLIDKIYTLHLETISRTPKNFYFRARIKFYRILSNITEAIGKLLMRMLKSGFSKKLDNKYDSILFSKKINFEQRADSSAEDSIFIKYDELFYIHKPIFFSLTTVLIFLYILKEYYSKDILHIIDFFQKNKEDQVFFVSFIIFVMLAVNWLLPKVLLFLLNVMVKIHNWSAFKKVRI